MARSKAAARGRREEGRLSARLLWECAGAVLLGAALLSAVALLSQLAPSAQTGSASERTGLVGSSLGALLAGAFGWGALALTAGVAALGVRLLLAQGVPPLASRFWVALALGLVSASSLPPLLHEIAPARVGAAGGGALGSFLLQYERWLFGSWGALLLNGISGLLAGLFAVGVPVGSALRGVGAAAGALAALGAALALRIARALRDLARGLRRGALDVVTGVRNGVRAVGVWRERRARRARVDAARAPLEADPPEAPEVEAAGADLAPPPLPASRRGRRGDPMIVDHASERGSDRPQQEAFRFAERTATGPHRLPDLSIFAEPPSSARSYDRESLIMNSRILEKKLSDFGVGGHVVTVHPGPVVTMYEFEPASGIKVNRIVSLSDDLALALRALSVRIIAPLPGKSVVGIEVANAQRDVVYLRDVLEAESLQGSSSKLEIALGKDIFGNPCHAELARMPHLLVAGATGTGKSVFLNSLLCSILCRTTPEELKLLLVDPKLLELSVYEGIPHLIADVVTNPKRAAAALAGVVHKMEERYRMMAALGVRSIDQYNARVAAEIEKGNTALRLKARPGEDEGPEVELARFPYIVVVIDELADLMVVSAREVEESLQRLAQMARAAGIHLVLATQRPSVDVLTGIIKANFPARISFQVSSRTDSRTILDQNGAEHLLGQGDMLFLPPGTSKLQRVHGAYVSEDEVGELTRFLREQGSPAFDETLIRLNEESEEREDREARGEEIDEMYDRAVALVAETRNASISYVQRRLKVGYNRAARMIEQMEQEGVVGPQIGTKPREVYVSPIGP